MSKDLSEITDDYCMENYGHSNWGYLDTYTKEDLADESTYDIEDGKVFWYKPDGGNRETLIRKILLFTYEEEGSNE